MISIGINTDQQRVNSLREKANLFSTINKANFQEEQAPSLSVSDLKFNNRSWKWEDGDVSMSLSFCIDSVILHQNHRECFKSLPQLACQFKIHILPSKQSCWFW